MSGNNGTAPEPKPRKHMRLFQAYLFYDEITRMKVRHANRKSAVERGASTMDAGMEAEFLSWLEPLKNQAAKIMVSHGEDVGPIWSWVTSIRGLGEGSLAACLLAQIDDIALFDTVSKLWRFAGKAVIDGKAEVNKPGEKSHSNRKLKTVCWQISDQFIKQQTPVYVDIYYAEKERQRRLYPEKIKNDNGKWMYNDGHIHNRAKRKTEKIFLQHLWVNWRRYEGLSVSEPYVQAIMGHTNIITYE